MNVNDENVISNAADINGGASYNINEPQSGNLNPKKNSNKDSHGIKRGRVSIKWRIFFGFSIFTALILLLMWLFQIVFLDDIYRNIKLITIKDSAKAISARLEEDTIKETATAIADKNELCVYIISEKGETLLSVDKLRNCAIHNIDDFSIFTIYSKTVNSDGELYEIFRRDRDRNIYYSLGEGIYSGLGGNASENGDGHNSYDNFDSESLIYSTIVKYSDGTEAMLMLNAIITPVSATVTTLNILFGFMTLIMILIAALLAFLLSRYISRPIVMLDNKAKQLAAGNYDVDFPSGGYREASELGQTLNYAASELGKVDALRRELIANISHDLRTPLTMIRGYAEVMRDIPDENTPENAAVIVDESARLSTLVNDMLDISKLESGNVPLDIKSFSLSDSVSAAVVRYRHMLSKDGYSFVFSCDNDYTVTSDENRVMQALCNLLNNAVTYTGEDKTVCVNVGLSPDNQGFVRISVSDSGEGIDSDKLALIWDRYYKVDKQHKRAAVGTGLGLSIVKSVILMLGGNCGVVSRTGENSGSTFWIEVKL